MGALEGRVAIITGAGRGVGREHALLFAAEGARVVVNDLGGAMDGSGAASGPANDVVEEIRALGGEAIANTDSVSDWEGAQRLVQSAIDAFGELHVLVNNAGILRDRLLVNMSAEEWDAIMDVHLRGTFATTRWAAAYWRNRSKAGNPVKASVINTVSTSGVFGNPGQANYGAAKAGIAAFSIIAALELHRYGVRVNCIAPAARTRLTEATPGMGDVVKAPEDAAAFDQWDPANVSPLVAVLATEDCPISGQTYAVAGGLVQRLQPWTAAERIVKDERWTVAELTERLADLPVPSWVDASTALAL